MIYTLTPNPALDIGGTVNKIIPNEKTYVRDETRHAGGNAINAARIIAKLGCPVTATGFLGGSVGYEVRSLLDDEGIRERFVKVKGNTRINLTVSEQISHRQTRLSFPGPTITVKDFRALLSIIAYLQRHDLLIIGGSLPPGFTTKHLSQLIWLARKQGVPCIVDVPPPALKSAIREVPLLIKPNLHEFQELVGKKVRSKRDIITAARALRPAIPLICVSSVDNGALLISPTTVWFGRGPRVSVKSTIGAGDSMVGAMAAHFWKKRIGIDPDEDSLEKEAPTMLKWGMAAALATVSTSNTFLGRTQEIKALYKRIRVEEV